MRRVIAWALYWLGDFASHLIADWQPEWLGLAIYRVYNRLMLASIAVQGSGEGPWNPA